MNEKIMSMERDLPQIKIDIGDMKKDISEMKVKLDVLWRIHLSTLPTPINLNLDEQKALKASGVGAFVDVHYPEILSVVRSMKPDNPNQAHELLIKGQVR